MFDLLDSVNPKKLGAKTTLFDSWFAYPAIISKIVRNYSLHVVCMIKRSPKIHYTYEGESYTLNQLYEVVEKIIYIYAEQGKKMESLYKFINRIGFENFKNDFL